MFFDDLIEGYQFETIARTLSRDAIVDFAKSYDPQSFHLDEVAAAASPFGGLIASGFQTLLTSFVQTLEAEIWSEASMGSPGIDELRWLIPVRPDDSLRTRGTVRSATPSSSRPDRGRVVIFYEVLNQKDEAVMTYLTTHILRRKTG